MGNDSLIYLSLNNGTNEALLYNQNPEYITQIIIGHSPNLYKN